MTADRAPAARAGLPGLDLALVMTPFASLLAALGLGALALIAVFDGIGEAWVLGATFALGATALAEVPAAAAGTLALVRMRREAPTPMAARGAAFGLACAALAPAGGVALWDAGPLRGALIAAGTFLLVMPGLWIGAAVAVGETAGSRPDARPSVRWFLAAYGLAAAVFAMLFVLRRVKGFPMEPFPGAEAPAACLALSAALLLPLARLSTLVAEINTTDL